MNVIGIDPGTDIDNSYAVVCTGDTYYAGQLSTEQTDETTVLTYGDRRIGSTGWAIIEWPVTIPGNNLDDTIRTADRLALFLKRSGVQVFIPNRLALLAHVGYKVGTRGNRDTWVNRQLKNMGYKTGKGTMLDSSHARSAFLCCLFAYDFAGNKMFLRDIPSQYMYNCEIV